MAKRVPFQAELSVESWLIRTTEEQLAGLKGIVAQPSPLDRISTAPDLSRMVTRGSYQNSVRPGSRMSFLRLSM
jgi:hypothetical protein